MTVQEAKDFLVQQTVQQAFLDRVSLSELERRLMYFTEDADASENPVDIDDEVEGADEPVDYEAKISRLLHRAYSRLKKENRAAVREWDESIRVLRKGDHYILVLWGSRPAPERTLRHFLKLLTISLVTAVVGGAVIVGGLLLSDHYGIRWPSGPSPDGILKPWVNRLLLMILVGVYVYSAILPWFFKGLPMWRVRFGKAKSPTELRKLE